jgi:hypothetical protein
MSTIWTIREALEVSEQYLLLILFLESFHEMNAPSIVVSNQPSTAKNSIASIHSDLAGDRSVMFRCPHLGLSGTLLSGHWMTFSF